MSEPREVDVLICGAGPVGLVLAYQLSRLNISTYIIDTANKSSPEFPMYGRACTLLPRTLEMLDQLDLYDDLAQVGLASSRSFTYRDGQRVFGRGWEISNAGKETFFKFNLNIRLKFSEDVFRSKLEELGVEVHAPLKLTEYSIEESASDDYKVSIECENPKGDVTRFRSKYIVGADGGSSAVRRIADIPFPGLHKAQYWVRIDGMVKTNLPEARLGFGTFESSTHGQVLWVALDHNATRVGYVLSDKLFEKYGQKMTQEQAVYEAKLACAPFEVEFEEVHWHTVYGIQQHVADRLVDRSRIILAGDAAHTHSSGTAQGMNTGMHDVVNLGWRLAGVLKGWYKQAVLENYSDERRAVAQQLINNDKIISMLINGEKPESMKDRSEDPMILLREFLYTVVGFTNGLDIGYERNILNDVDHALASVKVKPGSRGPDALLRKNGLRQHTVRLHEVTRYNGKFRVLVFAGQPSLTLPRLKVLRAQIDKHKRRFGHAVDFVTIVEGMGQVFDEHLGIPKFGKAYWDADSNAHWTYGAVENLGAIVVLRPDGILGTSAPLVGFHEVVVPYFERLVNEKGAQKPLPNGSGDVGELININENNLEFSMKSSGVGTIES